ncbi:MAG: glycosyltransferase family 4 protein [Gemmataceae bacterium]
MQLTAFVDRLDHVCCRYRLAAFRPFWESANHSLELRPLPRRLWPRLAALRLAGDTVVVQRRLLSRGELWLLRRRDVSTIFDFDDAVWLRDSFSPKGIHSRRRLRRFAAMIQATDAVVAGNDFLAERARQFTDPRRVHVIPTCVEPAAYPLAAHRAGRHVRLVWIGSSSTLTGLRHFAPTLEEIGARIPGASLKLICDRFAEFRHLPTRPCVWSEHTQELELAAADVGIAWMPDDDWSRGKCGLKLLQYMAAGLPVVANPVGVHRELIRRGENGFLADTAAEWCEAVRTLAGDPELRRKMGAAGRQRVEREFSVAAGARRWERVFAGMTSERVAA